MLTPEKLFIATCKEIESLEKAMKPYEVLKLSALLRKLLIDEHPLIDQVNIKHKVKIIFTITDFQLPNIKINIWNIADGLDPNTARPGRSSVQIGKDAFLNKVVLINNGNNYSIREIVKYEANIAGGVHLGKTKTDKESDLKKLDEMFRIGGYTFALRQLKAISRVVLKASEPLKQEIEKDKL